jgi:hypothetical protein
MSEAKVVPFHALFDNGATLNRFADPRDATSGRSHLCR